MLNFTENQQQLPEPMLYFQWDLKQIQGDSINQ